MRYHRLTVEVIEAAGRSARALGHSYVGGIHLLLALLEQRGETGQLLRSMGLDPKLTHQVAAVLYGSGDPALPLPQGFSQDARGILRGAAKEAKTLDALDAFDKEARAAASSLLSKYEN